MNCRWLCIATDGGMGMLRLALWCCLLTAAGAQAAAQCDFGQPHPDAPEQLGEFAFLIGEHEITLHAWTGEGWSPPRPQNARWRGWYGLGGQAIYDEWIDPQPASANHGINVRIFDPAAGEWRMMWLSTAATQATDLRAQVQDGVLTMWQVYPPRPGWKAEFEVIGPGQWARVAYRQDDAGRWQPQFRLAARRLPCQESPNNAQNG